MKLSQYFAPFLKEDPAEAQIVSHRLLLRAGMIRMVGSGIYNWLPMGLKVLRKVENIVRAEMNASGAQEILMPMVHPRSLWDETGRWSKYDAELLRFKDRHENDFCLAPTHEETVTDLFKRNAFSYRDCPKILYHIQLKFRDETRPRFGLMRAREFIMKDAYSFDVDVDSAMQSYETMKQAYIRTFTRFGLDFRMVAADTGNIGGDYSHEFHVLAGTGEDTLIFDTQGEYAVNVEKHNPATCAVPPERLEQKKGIEVGHIFLLKDVYSKPMQANITMADSTVKPVTMGCYGIGVSRIVAAAIEQNHDENGIIWPAALAPFQVVLLNLKPADSATTQACEKFYATLQNKGVEVLYDDRESPAGEKFAVADLIGCPWQCIIGPKGVAAGKAEWKNRRTGARLECTLGELPEAFTQPTIVAA